MQQRYPLNNGWLYKEHFDQDDTMCCPESAGFETVDLPHTNKILPYNYFDEASCQFISCYKKTFTLPEKGDGRLVYLDLEGVMLACEIWCNGVFVGSHEGGYTPFTVDLTGVVCREGENTVVIKTDSTERPDIPPFGNVVDYMAYGGIYREVWLRMADEVMVERLWLSCPDPLADEKWLLCECEITAKAPRPAKLTVTLKSPDDRIIKSITVKTSLISGTSRCLASLENLQDIALWDLDSPVLYTVTATLDCQDITDVCRDRFGFRAAAFTPEGFFFNGRRLCLTGLNRHQSWPYVGYAMPERIQRRDARILKQEAGCNIVRTSHYPQSRHFLDACDELGLLVMEEIPGWQHIGDLEWQKHSLQDTVDMITRDYNRPSVVLWGVRINESADNHDFYSRTNELARKTDLHRQTGGVRYIQRSELLEDVYTYNDFTHNGGQDVFRSQRETTGLDYDVPILVTESNGHMYPTKRFDQEARMAEHALRHLRVLNETLGREDLAGGISWCAFDYNTHGCFGSGDKICYHGVYDMFRNPKYAAYAYSSQKRPEQGVVLEPATLASRGERDGGGSVPFYVLTNCDFVRLWKNGALVEDFYPDTEGFPHLPHPPVLITHLMEESLTFGFSPEDTAAFREFLARKLRDGGLTSLNQEDLSYMGGLAKAYNLDSRKFVGMVIRSAGGWGDTENSFVLEGFVGDESVCRREIGEHKYSAGIRARADDSILYCSGDTYDSTRITVSAVDNMGNITPFTQECVEVVTEGPAVILGPTRFPLTGGVSSFWIRTVGRPGRVALKIQGVYDRTECTVEVEY